MTAIDGGMIETSADVPPSSGCATIHDSLVELIDWHEPEAVALEEPLLRPERALGDGRRPGPRGRHAGRGRARARLLRLHAAGREDGRLRKRRRRQGPGQAHGRASCSACPSSRPPTTPPTRSPSRSATPRTCRAQRRARLRADRSDGADARRRRAGRAHRDRLGQRRGARPPARPRRRRRRPASATGSPSPPRRCARCPPVGERSSLHAHLISRDDSLALYGFATEEERDLFLPLISVSGVGPKVAIAALSGGAVGELLRAIAAGDAKRFQAVPGIGKRTAERIIVELREKVAGELEERRRRSPVAARRRRPARRGARGAARPRLHADRGRAAARRGRGRDRRGAGRARAARGRGDRAAGVRPSYRADGDRADPTEQAADRRPTPSRGSPTPASRAGRRSSTAACARRGSRTSSASARSPTSSRSSSRPPAAAASRSTTCCSPARPGSARPRSPTSSPPSSSVPLVADRRARRSSARRDVASFLTTLEPGSVFFIDEIHRLNRAIEETLYPAMEDRKLPVVLGQGAGARTVTLDLPPFTLVGATTRAGLLTTPLRDRFGVCHRLEHYEPADLAADRRALGRDPRGRDRAAGHGGDRVPLARHAARREPAAEAGPRLRRGPRRGRRSRRRSRPRRCAMLEVDEAGLDRHDRAILDAIADEVRRRPGRPLDARRRRRRGAGHDRGRLRALPAAAGPDQAHPARPGRHRARLRAPRASPMPGNCRAALCLRRRPPSARAAGAIQ